MVPLYCTIYFPLYYTSPSCQGIGGYYTPIWYPSVPPPTLYYPPFPFPVCQGIGGWGGYLQGLHLYWRSSSTTEVRTTGPCMGAMAVTTMLWPLVGDSMLGSAVVSAFLNSTWGHRSQSSARSARPARPYVTKLEDTRYASWTCC